MKDVVLEALQNAQALAPCALYAEAIAAYQVRKPAPQLQVVQQWELGDPNISSGAVMVSTGDRWVWQLREPAQPKPDFYTACGYDDTGKLIALPGYSDVTEHGVKNRVVIRAREEGYKGTADARLAELGWEVLPARIVRSAQ